MKSAQNAQKQQSAYIKSLIDEGSKTTHNPAELELPEWVEPGKIRMFVRIFNIHIQFNDKNFQSSTIFRLKRNCDVLFIVMWIGNTLFVSQYARYLISHKEFLVRCCSLPSIQNERFEYAVLVQ